MLTHMTWGNLFIDGVPSAAPKDLLSSIQESSQNLWAEVKFPFYPHTLPFWIPKRKVREHNQNQAQADLFEIRSKSWTGRHVRPGSQRYYHTRISPAQEGGCVRLAWPEYRLGREQWKEIQNICLCSHNDKQGEAERFSSPKDVFWQNPHVCKHEC